MFDLLATIVQTDPAPIAAWMLLLLALGMYPVGILFPSCCACGNAPCENCPTGTLPDTVTVTFPAWDDEMPGAYRHRLSIGSITGWAAGAVRPSARVSETVSGEITKIDIVDGGSGYALVGRVAPTLTLSGGGGTGATFTPTLSSSGTPAVWTLDSATASGGSGYVDGSSLTITAAAGDTTVTKATATVVARGEPTITATAPGGTGASLSVSLSQSGSPPTWAVSALSVTSGGTGYTNGASVQFSAGGGVILSSATATVRVAAQAVAVDASGAGGTGATFSVAWSQPNSDDYSRQIEGIAVTNGGSGYDVSNGPVVLRMLNGTRAYGYRQVSELELTVAVDGGAIVSVDGIVDPSESSLIWGIGDLTWISGKGPIESVELTKGGSYYLPTGAAYGVTVTGGGSYYREDKTAAPYVANVTATVENGGQYSNTPNLTPVVDDDPNSATFGQIVSVTINDGGGNHSYRVLNIGKRCCKSIFGGRSFVLRRNPSDPCKFLYEKCEGLGTTRIELTLPATSAEYGRQPAYLTTYSGDSAAGGCGTTWTATTLVDDCSTLLPTGASSGDTLELEAGSRIATVVPGGNYTAGTTPSRCSRCCTGGTLPDEIEVKLEKGVGQSFEGWGGTYVLEFGREIPGPRTSAAWWFGGDIPGKGAPTIEAIAGGVSFGLATLSSSGDPAVYSVTGVQITSQDTYGFSVGTPVTFRVVFSGGEGSGNVNAAGYVSSVDANGKILSVAITNGGAYQGYRLSLQVQYQHCGEWTNPPGIRKQDPSTSTDLVGVRTGFGNTARRQSIGVIAGDFEKPSAPPPPYPAGWACPKEDINTPYADDSHPDTAVSAEDYVSHCGTDCSHKCFLIATVVRTAGSNANSLATAWDDSKPRGAPFIHAEEEGRPRSAPSSITEGYLDKILSGYEVFFSYFDIPYCYGGWIWLPSGGFWSLQFPPVVDIANVWPGRPNDLSRATCAACQSNLCTPSGSIEIRGTGPYPDLDPNAVLVTISIQ